MLAVALMAGVASAADYRIEDKEPIHRIMNAATLLDVDTISGTIEVVGDGGNNIRIDGERVIRGREKGDVDRAKKEVTLDMNEKGGTAQLFENGPFRDRNRTSDNHGFHDHDDRHYDVAYNLTIKVPKSIGLRLHTVNGSIRAAETNGKFDMKTINGKITMTGIAGSGSVDALNGDTTLTFRENPKSDSFFKSFNGKVDVTLQAGLNADFRLKTFNGGAYTDFDGSALAAKAEGSGERRNGKFVYRSRGEQSLRVGSGGPELKFETFNGDIRIHKQ
jgi:DUF4097 and DUF4098 domain-containing protein YvlB